VKRLQPELYQAVRNLAEATWARLQVFARQAEKEAKDLRRKLERAARGFASKHPSAISNRQSARPETRSPSPKSRTPALGNRQSAIGNRQSWTCSGRWSV
ncbi:MAG TPA: hypothetical protein VMG63_08725, partial [Terriglobia bacterium]|nr:hypothetical protein [Terriglobia bacterium]